MARGANEIVTDSVCWKSVDEIFKNQLFPPSILEVIENSKGKTENIRIIKSRLVNRIFEISLREVLLELDTSLRYLPKNIQLFFEVSSNMIISKKLHADNYLVKIGYVSRENIKNLYIVIKQGSKVIIVQMEPTVVDQDPLDE